MYRKIAPVLVVVAALCPSAFSQTILRPDVVEAIESHDSDKLTALLESGADANALDENETSALSLVLLYSLPDREDFGTEALKSLFSHGYKLEGGYKDSHFMGSTIYFGFSKMVQLLLDQGLDPNLKCDGEYLTHIAQEKGRQEILELLISHGASSYLSPASARQARFVQASGEGDLKTVVEMLKHGADINGKNKNDELPLHQAVKWIVGGQEVVSVIEFLLSKGADPNLQADTSIRGIYGTALHVAMFTTASAFKYPTSSGIGRKVISLLLANGALVSARDKANRIPLHIAAEFNNVEGAKLLIEAGSKLNARDNKNWTPLDYAESREMTNLLKKYGGIE